MAILRVRDADGRVHDIRAIQGDKGKAGAGIHYGSYVGNIANGTGSASQYIDMGSPHVRAVLLQTDESLLLVTEDGVTVDGVNVADLISGTLMGRGDNMFLAVYYPLTNAADVTYHYVAFVEEETV